MQLPESYAEAVDWAPTGNQYVKKAVYGNDKSLGVRFELVALKNEAKSKALADVTKNPNEEVYDEVEMVFVRSDPKTESAHRVKDHHRRRWPELYRRFLDNRESRGMLIERWEAVGPAEKAKLMSAGFSTVEQLAEASGGQIERLGVQGFDLFERAKAHVRAREGRIDVSQFADSLVALQSQLDGEAEMRRQLETELEYLRSKRKGGRPKKTETPKDEVES